MTSHRSIPPAHHAARRALNIRARRGFTLIEVLLAAFVLALGVLGLAALFAGGARQQQLANETTRATSLSEAAIAERGNAGVMSSLDEDGDGVPDFEQAIDIGRWYAIGTRIDPNDNYFNGRFGLVSRRAGGQVLRYGAGFFAAGTGGFQPFFRKPSARPIVVYQRPPHWNPRFNDDAAPFNGPGPIAEASLSAAQDNYNPRNPASPFLVPPYSLYDDRSSTPLAQKLRGPAFLPDRAILPESLQVTVTYFEYDKRFDPSATPPFVIADYDRFTTPDGDGDQIPTGARSAHLRGRVLPVGPSSDFRWVNPRNPVVRDAINGNREVPRNNLMSANDFSQPFGASGPRFPSLRVWESVVGTGVPNLYPYAVLMPNAGTYTNVDPTDADATPDPDENAPRPSYLVMYLAPDFEEDDLSAPNPAIVAYELAGVLTPNFSNDQAGFEPLGPQRSVEQIRVDRYVWRNERAVPAEQRVITASDPSRASGVRPVVAYSTLYRRTLDGNGELAIFAYRVSPTSSQGRFIPWEDLRGGAGTTSQFADNGNSPLVSAAFDVRWDAARRQFYVALPTGNADAVIRQGNIILFAGPADDDDNEAELAPGADAPVRIISRVRVGGQLRGYLDAPPQFRGRPLGDLGDSPPGNESLMGWFVRDRVLAQPADPASSNQPDPFLYQLEALEVRILPIAER